jgi:class 3 adenylate cyclase
VLFTDIVGSTEFAGEMGDRQWRELLARHHRLVRRELKRSGGREVETAGNSFFATFAEPASAIRCGLAVADASGSWGSRSGPASTPEKPRLWMGGRGGSPFTSLPE